MAKLVISYSRVRQVSLVDAKVGRMAAGSAKAPAWVVLHLATSPFAIFSSGGEYDARGLGVAKKDSNEVV